ncbi:unnamed protein product [Trifolium pratense]|uniref:Uncharacterized protein n=1 Tax=Trifolium pratense TaxID=57577 RepID=A0ACB0IBL7_TRIPR|nr:unnamed protein product [Trifolium pratense]
MNNTDPYGLPEDLRRLISSSRNTNTQHLPAAEPPCQYGGSASGSFPPPPPQNYCYNPPPIIVGDVFYPRSSNNTFPHNYDYSSTVNPTTTISSANSDHATASASAFCVGLETCSIDINNKGWFGNFDSSNNRWPRQETLSLLEIRSRLDSKFRENNQKAPLWNEISRIMAEEFGYQRSGKKCKEKFENLYKYYKKTKEGKASRQDGKHYRFFRQLEAICGEASTSDKNTPHVDAVVATQTPNFTINQENINGVVDHNLINNLKYSESLSFSNSSEFETSSSENNDEDLSAIAHTMKTSKQKGVDKSDRRGRKSWRGKVEEIVDSHMKKIIETQDAWMERMLSVVEQREQEMALREEERKRKESMRFDQEIHELWAKEKAWVEARDSALLEVVRKHIGVEASSKNESNTNYEHPFGNVDHGWTEMEISSLIQLRTSFEHQVREKGYLDDCVWDEIGEKMVYMGFNRNGVECKKIWDEISMSLRRSVDCGVKITRPWCLGLKVTDDDDL